MAIDEEAFFAEARRMHETRGCAYEHAERLAAEKLLGVKPESETVKQVAWAIYCRRLGTRTHISDLDTLNRNVKTQLMREAIAAIEAHEQALKDAGFAIVPITEGRKP